MQELKSFGKYLRLIKEEKTNIQKEQVDPYKYPEQFEFSGEPPREEIPLKPIRPVDVKPVEFEPIEVEPEKVEPDDDYTEYEALVIEPDLWREREEYDYGYHFGALGEDDFIDQHNADVAMYGASMNKPILALINLIIAKDGGVNRRLTPSELDDLIVYRRGSDWSNRTNKVLSNRSKSSTDKKAPKGY